MKIDIENLKKRILYRSQYRGTKEMDKLLHSFILKYINEPDLLIYLRNLNIDKIISISKNYNCKIIFQTGMGYGNAIVEGIKHSKTTYSCIFYADGSTDPKYISLMLEKSQNENLDLVFGSRYEKEEIAEHIYNSKNHIVLGGGTNYFLPIEEGGIREDGVDFVKKIKKNFHYLETKKDLDNFNYSDRKKIFGFSKEILFINSFSSYLFISPVKSLSVHFANINSSYGLSPYINYKALWEENNYGQKY